MYIRSEGGAAYSTSSLWWLFVWCAHNPGGAHVKHGAPGVPAAAGLALVTFFPRSHPHLEGA